MKKILKIIIFNLIFIVFIFLSFEYYLYKKNNDKLPFISFVNHIAFPYFNIQYKFISLHEYYVEKNKIYSFTEFRRPVLIKNTDKKPIILFGCSFAWGYGLKERQTFCYKLSKLLKRSIYNRAICSWGTQHMLYQLKQEDFYNQFPEPEYIIYLYISNHISRIYKYLFMNSSLIGEQYNYLKYNDTIFGLKEEKRFQNVPYSRIYNQLILPKLMKIEAQKNGFKFLEKHLIESKKEVDKHWKNVKFVILDYEADNYFNDYPEVLNYDNVEKLKKDGFIVIKTSELTDIKLDDNFIIGGEDKHPNEAAWNLITPLFVKKLQEYN